MKIFRAVIFLALIAGTAFAQRPHNPFVNKYETNERSRQLAVALNTNMWIMYDLPQCQLYQAWAGGANGGTLTMPTVSATGLFFNQVAHFPYWFITSGNNYFKESVGEFFSSWAKPADIDLYYTKWKQQPRNYQAWNIVQGGTAVATKTRYRGYLIVGDVFTLNFGLIGPDGHEISVTEVPEYSNAGGKNGLTRKFTFTGIPAGSAVSLKLAGTGWTGTGVSGGVLTQSADGSVTITGAW